MSLPHFSNIIGHGFPTLFKYKGKSYYYHDNKFCYLRKSKNGKSHYVILLDNIFV